MTTSGTYNFNPAFSDIILYAANAIGMRPTEITQEFMQSARMAANLITGTWAQHGINLWEIALVQQALTEGVAGYTYDPSIVSVLDCYISIAQADGSFIDRIIMSVGRSEYASYPNKTQQGFPTVYWADRTLAPSITLWPVPDGQEAYLKYYAVKQIQDINTPNGATLDLPNYFYEAFAMALAFRLAILWAPERAVALKAFADELYEGACTQNVENNQVYILPNTSGYWRV